MIKILERLGVKEKIYPDGESPDQKGNEHYREFNKGQNAVMFKGAHVWEMASAGGPGGWGNHIAWSTSPFKGDGVHGSVVGFCRGRFPEVGELIVSKFQSGRYFYVAVTKVEPCKNPNDMFFADVKVVLVLNHKSTIVKTMN